MSDCVSVCLSVCVHDNSKKYGSVHLKLEHIVAMKIAWKSSTLGIVQSRSRSQRDFKFLSINHNTNCQVLYLSFGTC